MWKTSDMKLPVTAYKLPVGKKLRGVSTKLRAGSRKLRAGSRKLRAGYVLMEIVIALGLFSAVAVSLVRLGGEANC